LMALTGCGGYREPAPPAVAELTVMLKSDDPNVQIEAANWVEQLGVKASDTGPALTTALKSPDPRVRRSAAAALGRIGPAAERRFPR